MENEIDFDQLAEDLDEYDWIWINMGDEKVCPDCERWAALDAAPLSEWIQNRAEPGRGESYCEDHCRCLLAPADLIKTNPDLKEGGKITIKDPGDYNPDPGTDYKTFEELDAAILEYKVMSGGAKLPDEFFLINDAQGRIDFLKGFRPGGVTNPPPPPAPKPEAPIKLGKEVTQAQIDAEAKADLKSALAKLEKLKSIPEMEIWAKENIGISKFRELRDLTPEVIKSTLSRIAELKAEWTTPDTNVFVFTGTERGSNYASASWATMNLNPKYFNDEARFLKSLAECVKTGFHPRGAFTIQSVIDHEFVHIMTTKDFYSYSITGKAKGPIAFEIQAIKSKYTRELNKTIKQINVEIRSLQDKMAADFIKFQKDQVGPSDAEFKIMHEKFNAVVEKDQVKLASLFESVKNVDFRISEYAKKNIHEFAAEAFVDYKYNPSPGKYSKLVYDLLKKTYYKGGN